jgi:hypothetical protein
MLDIIGNTTLIVGDCRNGCGLSQHLAKQGRALQGYTYTYGQVAENSLNFNCGVLSYNTVRINLQVYFRIIQTKKT